MDSSHPQRVDTMEDYKNFNFDWEINSKEDKLGHTDASSVSLETLGNTSFTFNKSTTSIRNRRPTSSPPTKSVKQSFIRTYIRTRERNVKSISHSILSPLAKKAKAREILGMKFNQLEIDEASDKILRRKSLILAIFATLGIILMIITNAINFDFFELGEYYPLEVINLPAYKNWKVYFYHIIKVWNLLNTVICIFLLMSYYRKRVKIEKKMWHFSNSLAAFLYSPLWKQFILELILLAYTPILPFPFSWFASYPDPSNNACYSKEYVYSWLQCNESIANYYKFAGIGDKFGLVMFFRIYLWIRVFRDFSSVYQNRRRIIEEFSKKGLYIPNFGWKLTMRMFFTDHPYLFLATILLTVFSISSYCTWISERSINDRIAIVSNEEVNLIWFIGASMLSTGYGDVQPVTYTGKILGIITALFGTLFVTMLTGHMVRSSSPSQSLVDASNYLKLDVIRHKYSVQGIRWLQVHWLYKKGKCSVRYMFKTKQSAVKGMNRYRRKAAAIQLMLQEVQKENAIEQLQKENAKLEKQVKQLKQNLLNLSQSLEPILNQASKEKFVHQSQSS